MKIEDKHGTVSYQNQKKLYETYKNEPLFGLVLCCIVEKEILFIKIKYV